MEAKVYTSYLYELQKHKSDWINIVSITDDTIKIDLQIPCLSLTARIQIDVRTKYGLVILDAQLLSPNIEHPNIGPSRYFCIGKEDTDWDESIMLLVWGIAELLVNPNFDDPLLDCCSYTDLQSYLLQPALCI